MGYVMPFVDCRCPKIFTNMLYPPPSKTIKPLFIEIYCQKLIHNFNIGIKRYHASHQKPESPRRGR